MDHRQSPLDSTCSGVIRIEYVDYCLHSIMLDRPAAAGLRKTLCCLMVPESEDLQAVPCFSLKTKRQVPSSLSEAFLNISRYALLVLSYISCNSVYLLRDVSFERNIFCFFAPQL
jgi:hypothetical protein